VETIEAEADPIAKAEDRKRSGVLTSSPDEGVVHSPAPFCDGLGMAHTAEGLELGEPPESYDAGGF
jgi:hypothetical protein